MKILLYMRHNGFKSEKKVHFGEGKKIQNIFLWPMIFTIDKAGDFVHSLPILFTFGKADRFRPFFANTFHFQ